MPIPNVVIVGRPNVGKSSLLNMLARRQVAIVDPTAGVTRDRVGVAAAIPAEWRGQADHPVRLIDTGGFGITDLEVGDHGHRRDMTADVERQIARGVAEADLVLLVIDAQAGVTGLDERFAEVLRKQVGRKAVLIVANKVDAEKHEAAAYDAARLGFGELVMVSAKTGHHKHRLHDAIRAAIDWDKFDAETAIEEDDDEAEDGRDRPHRPGPPLFAIVGKRNAGKSTLVNALAHDERVIVSEQPGTTRDSVDVEVEIDGHKLTLIDTAGVRKAKSLAGDIEFYSQHRALRSVRRADVCLLLVDATEPVSQVDKKLINEILKHHRPTVIVVNKWDLVADQHTQDEYAEYLDDALKGLSFAPIVFASAKDGEGLTDAIAMGLNLYEQARHRMSTGELNRIVEQILLERGPSSKGGKQAKVYYVTQVAVDPPSLALFVNDPSLFEGGYERYLLNRFRDELPFSEVPIRLFFRPRQQMSRGD
jgi:GTP-binding protein